MKNLWTPWRMSYIQGKGKTAGECIFDIRPRANYDRENLILYRGGLTVVLLNRFPYANGHLLIAPTRHLAEITDLDLHENQALMQTIQESVAILRRHMKPHGFNIGLNIGAVAGAGLADHLHFHIVPRWEGDHNYMTVLAEIRTIPEHIERTFDLLLPDFKNLTIH